MNDTAPKAVSQTVVAPPDGEPRRELLRRQIADASPIGVDDQLDAVLRLTAASRALVHAARNPGVDL